MIRAVLRIMTLRLLRDRGALVLVFLLPGFIFAIFASIFSNAAGGNLDLRVAMGTDAPSPEILEIVEIIQSNAPFNLSYQSDWREADVRTRVRLGHDDVGFILRDTTSRKDNADMATITIIKDPSRDVAASVLMGQLRQIIAEATAQNITENTLQNPPAVANITRSTPKMFDVKTAVAQTVGRGPEDPSVTYYVGATAILFLLFSAMQGASISLEERQSGITDRLLLGSFGLLKFIFGKFLYLTLVGVLQVTIIMAVANIFFGVSVSHHIPALILVSIGSAALAAAIALLTVAMCRTSAQMNTVSTFAVLLFSAVGGSMVPRFMMPEWLQTLGVFTPNYWSIEGFYGTLAREQSITDLWHVWLILFGGSAILMVMATFLSYRFRRA